jgi:hypothetical protein
MNNEWEGGQSVQSNWFKFDTVGKFVKGTLLNKKFKDAEGIYGAQYIYELLTKDGVMFVPVPASKQGTIDRLNRCQLGEVIGIMYEKDIQSDKGGKAAKALTVKTWGMDPNYNADGSVNMEVFKEAGIDVKEVPFE